MGDRNGTAITGRKRGHQHHPRQSGARRSNVPATEVIAALRGETLPYHEQIEDVNTTNNAAAQAQQNQRRDSNQNIILPPVNLATAEFDDTQLVYDSSQLSNDTHSKYLLHDNMSADICDINVERNDHFDNVTIIVDDRPATSASSLCDDEKLIVAKPIDSSNTESKSVVNSPSSSSSNKKKNRTKPFHESKGDRSNTGGSADKSTEQIVKRKKKSNHKDVQQLAMAALIIGEERPPLEGAASDDIMEMEENDPEAAEWSKLRCTSERTEVVAEREYRRQNRRCADYPGLAFGRSIFSSDTMMKFNIIRNELHNIMKTQLKRVRFPFLLGGGNTVGTHTYSLRISVIFLL